MMQVIRRLSGIFAFAFLLLTISACKTGAQPPAQAKQTPIQTIDMPQGGRIAYGAVPGADSQGSAMMSLLRNLHQVCGERPQIGSVFKLRGTDSVGVFFTVIDHSKGNKPIAGLIIAAGSEPNKAEAALMSDSADHFASSVNPMLSRLFSVWHPGGGSALSQAGAPSAGPSAGAHSTASSSHAAPAAKLHTVTAPDNSATIGIPDGWALDSRSGEGAIIVMGPRGESLGMNMMRNAVDPTNRQEQQTMHLLGVIPGTIVYPYHGNLVKAFPDLFQAWRRAGGQGPAPLQIDSIEALPEPPGNFECVHAKGQINPDGKGMKAMNDMMCAILPLSWGGYSVTLSHSLTPLDLADQEHETLTAMITSYKQNQQVRNQQMAQQARQKADNDQAIMQDAQRQIGQINALGAQATARYNATQAANDAQHASYWSQQDANAKNGAGFSNYILDQTVIRDVQDPNTHATVWNRTADAWQKAYPDRIEQVPTSQYIKSQDY